MRKTVERTLLLSSIRDEAGRVMRSFLDGEILRNSLAGAIHSLFMLEIQFSDIVKEKHELGEINYVIKTQMENEENIYLTLEYVRAIFKKTKVFGEQ